ncbi:heterogeneous nuclear ribonucleoprotein H [Condylostylus longicornis]|uniref:heterogeneous nuclear ribonucleoprotein H n=1 Tax=Condylostylus longicornis TaxID=2530218 RepID=UPI00244DB0CA|nr:heterogeneous nuclear ribonucleoprotein H [Condylostylus longicornis]
MTRFIRLRGLPWSANEEDILKFLSGVNVVGGTKGVYMVTYKSDGRNTGEAFVELESPEDEEEAFKHNKETIGHRYIEIFSASNEEAEHAMKKPNANSNVLKLRGLPYSITEEQIEKFFDGLEIKPDREGILIVMDRRGRASGEAYVQFETLEDTEQALKRNREKIGHRYIEIFRSSIGEMRRQSGSRSGPYDRKDRGGGLRNGRDFARSSRNSGPRGGSFNGRDSFGSSSFGSGGRFNDRDNDRFDSYNSFGSGGGSSGNPFNRNGSSNSFNNSDFGGFGSDRNGGGNSFGPVGSGRSGSRDCEGHCVHMRGLPYYCFVNDVNKFFDPIRPNHVEIIYNSKGLHSGTAKAFFETHEESQLAMKKHRKQMGNRYIELFYDGKLRMGSSGNSGGNPRRL